MIRAVFTAQKRSKSDFKFEFARLGMSDQSTVDWGITWSNTTARDKPSLQIPVRLLRYLLPSKQLIVVPSYDE